MAHRSLPSFTSFSLPSLCSTLSPSLLLSHCSFLTLPLSSSLPPSLPLSLLLPSLLLPSLFPPSLSSLSLSPLQLSDQDCIIINPTTNTLTVCNTTASSAGWYSCFVRNLAGTAEFSVPVTIIPEPPIAPNITTSSRTLIIESGEPLILDCIAVGIPRPTVTWFKDEVSLEQCVDRAAVYHICLPLPPPLSPSLSLFLCASPLLQVLLNSTCPDVFPGDCLLVDDVSVYIQDTRESDSGTYTCVAANSAGISVFAVHVLVQPLSSTCK